MTPDGLRTSTLTELAVCATSVTSWLNSTSTFGIFRKRSRRRLEVLNCSHWMTKGCRVSSLSTAWSNSATSSPVGRSQNWKIGATRPTRAMSATSASSSISSVAGCVVAARGSACGPLFKSNSRTGTPRRPSSHAHKRPTGPPPAINTLWSSRVTHLLHFPQDPGGRTMDAHPHAANAQSAPQCLRRKACGEAMLFRALYAAL